MSHHLIQTEDPNLRRDPSNHALLNTNSEAWKQYRQQREAQQSVMTLSQRVDTLEDQIKNIQSSLNLIVDLLQKR